MNKKLFIVFALVASFSLGFAFNSLIANKASSDIKTKRVTGIGGIFFKCKEPKKIREWYKVHLGLNTNQYGATFEWRQALDSSKKGFTEWNPFNDSTSYFKPSTKDFMINYRVANITWLVGELKKEGVTVLDSIESYDYGKFVHILDPENNKIELWEPIDAAYDKMGKDMGAETTK